MSSEPPPAALPSPVAAPLVAPGARAGTALAPHYRGTPLPAGVTDVELEQAERYAEAALAPATRRAYATDWRRFAAWCDAKGSPALPAAPPVVALHLAGLADAGLKPSSIGRALAAIAYVHRRARYDPPHRATGAQAIAAVLAGIRRTHGGPPARKAPADADVLHAMLRTIHGDGLRAVRNRALLAFGMAGAFRRSELVALTVADVAMVEDGMRVTIRRSKTDQDGAGQVIAIPVGQRLRPNRLLSLWIQRAPIEDGFLFRRLTKAGLVTPEPMSDRAVARLVQACARAAGYDPARFAAHSLRSGFLTAAAAAGASVFKMRDVSRHKSLNVLAGYVRDAELFQDHAGAEFL